MRWRPLLVVVGLGSTAAALVAAARHGASGMGHRVAGGTLMGDAARYDALTGRLLGSFYDGIAADVASRLSPGATVLDVGCGPGHLAVRIARASGADVTGVDLDPAMIDRATNNADRAARSEAGAPVPTFVAADVAHLPFPDGSFDVVVSTMSMHHWSDTHAGLAEIARVLAPDGRALVWDLRSGFVPLHQHLPDPADRVAGGPVRLVRADDWRWPLGLRLSRRLELAAATPA